MNPFCYCNNEIDGTVICIAVTELSVQHLSRLVGKPTMWFPNRSDTNRSVQAQNMARSLKFRI